MAQKDREIIDKSVTFHGTMAAALASYGLEPEPLMAKCCIDLAALSAPDARVMAAVMQQVWRRAAAETGDPASGIRFAQTLKPGTFHGLALYWAASETLMDAFQRMMRFHRVISTGGETVLLEEKDAIRVWIKLPVPAGRGADAVPADVPVCLWR